MKLIDIETREEEAHPIRLVVYGDPGAGKTQLIGTFMEHPLTCPVLVLNAAGQPITLRQFPPAMVMEVETMKDLNVPYQWFDAGQPMDMEVPVPFVGAAIEYLNRHGYDKFRTVAIDSMTQIQELGLREITGSTMRLPGDIPNAIEIQHWNKGLSQMGLIAEKYFELDMNVVMTAWVRHDLISSMGLTMFYPAIRGQAGQLVPGHAEIVGYIKPLPSVRASLLKEIRQDKVASKTLETAFNLMFTNRGRDYMAKWQGIDPAPELVVAPTATKLVDIIADAKVD